MRGIGLNSVVYIFRKRRHTVVNSLRQGSYTPTPSILGEGWKDVSFFQRTETVKDWRIPGKAPDLGGTRSPCVRRRKKRAARGEGPQFTKHGATTEELSLLPKSSRAVGATFCIKGNTSHGKELERPIKSRWTKNG